MNEMKRLKLNREYLVRHLGVALLMLGLSGWFAYDGYIAYPQHDEAWFAQQHLRKENATARQREFALLALIAALVIGANLYKVSRFHFEYDEEGFVYRGKRTDFAAVKSVDRSKWEKKGIIKVDGIVLDAWHFTGVDEVEKKLNETKGK